MTRTHVACAPSAPVAGARQTYRCVTDLYEEELRRGELIAGHCVGCGHTQFPPEPNCRECQSPHIRPVPLSGRGRLCSAKVAEHPDDLSLGDILLEEGIQLRALLIGEFEDPQFLTECLQNKPVEVTPSVIRTHGLSILAFEPA